MILFRPQHFDHRLPPPGYLFTDLKWERSAYGDYLILVIPHTEDMLDSLGYLRLVSVHIFNETLPN